MEVTHIAGELSAILDTIQPLGMWVLQLFGRSKNAQLESKGCHHFSKGATLTFISVSGFYDTLHTGAIAGKIASKRLADMLHANLSMFM